MTLEDKYKDMFEDGKEEGRAETKATLISTLHRNGLSAAEIAKLTELDEKEVAQIVKR